MGGDAVGNAAISSFDAVDDILRELAGKEAFPNLRSVVVAGHSGGGQFVQRYQMPNSIHEKIGVPITYVVSNPSSYAYVDKKRPTAGAVGPEFAAASPGYIPPTPRNPPSPFAAFSDARNCTTYNDWPYGLQNRAGYPAKASEDKIKTQVVARPVTYLLGELDLLPLYGFDGSCAAGAQGPTRLARGIAYSRYTNEKHGAHHKMLIVAACGHSARCMFTADAALPLLFPKE